MLYLIWFFDNLNIIRIEKVQQNNGIAGSNNYHNKSLYDTLLNK